MKVAIAREGDRVSLHFGYCDSFEIFDIKDNKIENKETVPNPGHRPGFLPVFLAEKGVNVMIAGGMGGSAYQLFQQNGIEVYTGVEGEIDCVIDAYVKGTLESAGGVCQSHDHKGD